MKTPIKTVLLAALAAVLSAPLLAQQPAAPDEEKVRLPPPIRLLDNSVNDLKLSEQQQQQYQQIVKQHAPPIQKQFTQQQSIYTPEQKTKRRQAFKQGKDDGLDGRELRQFVQSQVQLSPQQQKQHTDYQTQILKSQQQFRQDVVEILTPAQQEQLPPIGGKKGKGKGKGKRRPTPPDSGPPNIEPPPEHPLFPETHPEPQPLPDEFE